MDLQSFLLHFSDEARFPDLYRFCFASSLVYRARCYNLTLLMEMADAGLTSCSSVLLAMEILEIDQMPKVACPSDQPLV